MDPEVELLPQSVRLFDPATYRPAIHVLPPDGLRQFRSFDKRVPPELLLRELESHLSFGASEHPFQIPTVEGAPTGPSVPVRGGDGEGTPPISDRLRVSFSLLKLDFKEASIPIIHRDVKSTNILLDDNYIAKVSDFGASRFVPLGQNQLATVVQGTLGYLDPEYMFTSQLTEKSDVYSFGVVLVELITGKKALSFNRPEEERNLAMYFITCMNNDCLNQIIDEHMVIEGNIEELKEVANLAKRCLRVKGEERPYMKEVAMELEGLIKKKTSRNDLNSSEIEYLLDKASTGYVVGGYRSNTTTARVDSMVEDMILHGGR
ncbi:wall-associated receptor kinase 5-like [Camellia sinensis]|uniref:wall-associated receptor kinase 5-like n=1 Tax=Camellia sinensis TaxID=4442 RepID=UPI001035EF70|nr:wall-associated receptor kinase 5-like [Camellia sinensis]